MPNIEPNFNEMIREYRSLDLQEKEIKLRKDQLKEQARIYMEDNGMEAYKVKEGNISYSKYTRVSYDSKKLETMFNEGQLKPAKKESEVVSVRITPTKGTKE